MKFKFNLKYFLSAMFLTLIINYTMTNFSTWEIVDIKESKNQTTNYSVEKWDIQNSIEVVWSAELVDEQELSFNKTWTITAVYFDAWDAVKKWDIIAQIDNSDAYDNIDEAILDLETAKISLSQLYEDEDESKVTEAQNNIVTTWNNYDNSVTELENLKISQTNDLENLLDDIATSKKELENLIVENENSLNNTTSNKNTTILTTENNLTEYLEKIEAIIDDSDVIMWVSEENKSENDDFETYLWAKNTTIKTSATTWLKESIVLYDNLVISLAEYTYSWDSDELVLLLEKYLEIFNSLYKTSDYIYDTLDNSVTSVWSLSESEISSMQNTVSSNRDSALSKISSINNSINTISTLTNTDLIVNSNDLEIEKDTQNIEDLQTEYDEKVKEYALALKSKQEDVENKKVSYDVAQLNLEELLEWPTESNILKAENTITKAEIKLESAYDSLEDYELEAPFDWVVRKIDYMVWDNITSDTNKYVYIENPDLVEINVMLDQIDIVTVELWQDAIVAFDTYSTLPVKAKISGIDTTPVVSSGVVSYEVTLVLDDETFDKKLLSWMTADVEIITESKIDILTVKTTAITETDWKKYLSIQNNWKIEEVEIETWISSDWITEITSWVEEWDIVIVKSFEFISTEDEEESTSLFWTTTVQSWPGWGWGSRGR